MRVWKGPDAVSTTSLICHRKRIGSTMAWLVLAALLIGAWATPASARVQASIMLDARTGKTLEAHNPDSQCYPASLTKLMTLYMTFRELSTGKMTLEQQLTVSTHAAAQKPTKLYLKPGERVSVRSAILAITTRSANDAAVVLAEAIGGSESEFAEMMNQRARALGLTSTTFRNASGLPDSSQKTTARDMSRLAMAILEDFPEYYHFFKARRFEFRGRTIYGHDHLLARYPGVDGMKTGYTVASGFNIVTSAVRGDHRLLGVVMGGRSARSRDRQMMALLNRGFSQIRKTTVIAASNEDPTADREPVARFKKVSLDDTEQQESERPDAGWFVQLGGTFRSQVHARRALRSALHTDPEGLRDANPLVVKLRNGRFLARFSELDASTATQTCRFLRSRKFTCNAYQLKTRSLSMASASR
ncbi:MAG TPA: D-alanyl-D-alanine carboxypeptidase family protein [Terriglobia bacterium]|nr:D-alanyl-D-alanine carboxypeptidase family protein [Terriglobia bacterium]